MPNVIPEISGGSIVLLGSFNPKIFQPEWFVRQQLLTQEEADASDVKIIIQDLSHFETEQFTVLVSPDRFSVSSKLDANPTPLRDFVQGTFFVLEHTPVTAMGLNYMMHYALGSEESWHRLGDKLAPKDAWNKVLGGRPGLVSMTIQTVKDAPQGARFNVKVEPSLRIKYGVYFETNEHFPAPERESLKFLMEILRERWEEAGIYASRVANHILDWAKEEGG